MAIKFTIKGRLDGLNEYTKACRGNRFSGAEMKKRNQRKVKDSVMQAIVENQMHAPRKFPITVDILWVEKDKRRDVDNIQFGAKFILDALVNLNVLPDDSRTYVCGINNKVITDKENPRIEVEIK